MLFNLFKCIKDFGLIFWIFVYIMYSNELCDLLILICYINVSGYIWLIICINYSG